MFGRVRIEDFPENGRQLDPQEFFPPLTSGAGERVDRGFDPATTICAAVPSGWNLLQETWLASGEGDRPPSDPMTATVPQARLLAIGGLSKRLPGSSPWTTYHSTRAARSRSHSQTAPASRP